MCCGENNSCPVPSTVTISILLEVTHHSRALFLLSHKKSKTLSACSCVLALHGSKMRLFVGYFLLLWLLLTQHKLLLASEKEATFWKNIAYKHPVGLASFNSSSAATLDGAALKELAGPASHQRLGPEPSTTTEDGSFKVSHNVIFHPGALVVSAGGIGCCHTYQNPTKSFQS